MNFDETVVKELGDTFKSHGFAIIKQERHVVVFARSCLWIVLSYDYRDKSHTLSIACPEMSRYSVEIDANLLRDYYHSDPLIPAGPCSSFLVGVARFLAGVGAPLLAGELQEVQKLEEYREMRQAEYRKTKLLERTLVAVDAAWRQEDYAEVVRQLDGVRESDLSPAYAAKYKYAKKKMTE